MGALNNLFASPESVARTGQQQSADLVKHWNDYLSTIPEKAQIIRELPDSPRQPEAPLQRLKQLLTLELADVYTAEKEDNYLINDLRALEHSDRIKRFERLDVYIAQYETRFRHVFELLRHLYANLKSEAGLVERLLTVPDIRTYRNLLNLLRSEFSIEQSVLSEIGNIRTFPELFSALATGEHVIQLLDSKERKMVRRMQQRMHQIFSNELTEGITYQWTIAVFNSIEAKFRELEAQDIMEHHGSVHHELVNRPEFVDLVRHTIARIRPRPVSEQMINVFVHLFREWYNHEVNLISP